MTRNATRLTSSGITGFTLPGMIDDPGCNAGRLISAKTGARPRRQQDQIAGNLRQLDGRALERRGINDESLLLPRGRQHVFRRHDRLAGELRQMRRGPCGIALGRIQSRPDCRGAHVDRIQMLFRFTQEGDLALQRSRQTRGTPVRRSSVPRPAAPCAPSSRR